MDSTTLLMAQAYVDSIVYDGPETSEVEKDTPMQSPLPDLVGLKVTDKVPGRAQLVTPAAPPAEQGSILRSDGLYAEYADYFGLLDHPVLGIGGSGMLFLYPYFRTVPEWADAGMDSLIYAFEDTQDMQGMGLVIPKGWHVANSQTWQLMPADIEARPFFMHTDIFETIAVQPEYVQQLFKPKSVIQYTVQEANIAEDSDGDKYVCFVENLSGDVFSTGRLLPYYGVSLHVLEDGTLERNHDGKVLITYPVVRTLDKKYLPKEVIDLTGIIQPLFRAPQQDVQIEPDLFTKLWESSPELTLFKIPFDPENNLTITMNKTLLGPGFTDANSDIWFARGAVFVGLYGTGTPLTGYILLGGASVPDAEPVLIIRMNAI